MATSTSTSNATIKDPHVPDSSVDSLHEGKASVEERHDAQIPAAPQQPDDVEKQLSSSNEPQLHNGQAPAPVAPTGAHVNDLSSIPNGGAVAWMQVAGAFSLFFNTWYVDHATPIAVVLCVQPCRY